MVRAMHRNWRRAVVSRSTAAASGNLVDWVALRPSPLWNWWIQIHEFHEVGLRGALISHVADARGLVLTQIGLIATMVLSIPPLTR